MNPGYGSSIFLRIEEPSPGRPKGGRGRLIGVIFTAFN